MPKKTGYRKELNLLGIVLSVGGIYFLLTQNTNLLTYFGIAILGAILVGGLPSKKQMKKILTLNLANLIVSLAIGITYFKLFGFETAIQNVLIITFGIFFVGNVLIKAFVNVLKN